MQFSRSTMKDGFTVTQYIELLRIWHREILKKEKMLSTGSRVYKFLFFFEAATTSTLTTVATFLSSLTLGFIGNQSNTVVLALQCAVTALIVANGIVSAFGFVFKPQATSTGARDASRQYGGLAKELIIEIKSYEVLFAGMTDKEVSKFSTPDIGMGNRRTHSMNDVHINHEYDGINSIHDLNFPAEEIYIPITLDSDPIQAVRRDGLHEELVISFESYKNRLLYYSTREQLIACNEPGLILIGYWGDKTVFDRTYVSNVISPKDLQFIADIISKLEDRHDKRRMQKITTKLFMRMGVNAEIKIE